jgi:hypothetical protein
MRWPFAVLSSPLLPSPPLSSPLLFLSGRGVFTASNLATLPGLSLGLVSTLIFRFPSNLHIRLIRINN